MLVQSFLEDSSERFPSREALVSGERRLTYLELEAFANRVANVLIDDGLEHGDRVALVLESSVEVAGAMYGILKAGGVFVMIDPKVKERKLAFLLEDCQASFVVNGPATGIDDFWQRVQAASPERPEAASIDVDLASLIYTSGSTGVPKAVALSHLNMTSAVESITAYLELSASDRILNLSPLHFDYGLYNLFLAAQAGAATILEKPFISPHQIIRPIRDERVTGLPLVPSQVAILLSLQGLDRYDFSSVRYITSTGQSLPVRHIRRLAELFGEARIYSMYGLTECKRVSYLPPDEILTRPGSVGKAMPNTEAFLVDEEGRRIDTPGRIGELAVRGANVMEGYWRRPEETAEVLRSGDVPGRKLLLTGDLFRQDEEGYLYFVARKDDLIKSGGERISPKEVEAVVYELEDVLEAAAYSVEDEILGQALRLAVVLRRGSDLEETDLREHCSACLESSRVPRRIEILGCLPKTATGKVDRRALGARERCAA